MNRPIYLLADSQLLFWKNEAGEPLLASLHDRTQSESPRAAYIGASNGDVPEFYVLFREAMAVIGVEDCRHIPAAFSEEDTAFLDAADLILLAGGDVEVGWQSIAAMAEHIRRRYMDGATLVGVSAGAVQLGLYGSIEMGEAASRLIDTLKLVPFMIGAHEERSEWASLATVVKMLEGTVKGIGIPTGGGLAYHPDHSIEALRYPLHEIVVQDGRLHHSLILP